MTPHSSELGDRLVPSTEWVTQGMRDGKWTEVWGYSADLYAWDEFWS